MRSISNVSIRMYQLRYIKVFNSESGEIGDAGHSRVRPFAESADFDRTPDQVRRVLQLSQLRALRQGIGEQQIRAPQNLRVWLLLARRIRSHCCNVRARL